MFKKLLCLVLVSLLLLSMFLGCDQEQKEEGKALASSGTKVLTMPIIFKNAFLMKAIDMFQQKYPNIKIEVKDYDKDREKFLLDLKIDMMTGKGADIISVYGVPYKAYIYKGLFENLGNFIEKDKEFNVNNYYVNMFDALKYKGNMYVVPLTANIEFMTASKSKLDSASKKVDDKAWTFTDFMQIAESVTKDINGDGVTDQYALPTMGLEHTLQFVLKVDRFIDFDKKQANFDTEEFINLLRDLKQMEEKKLFHPDVKSTFNIDKVPGAQNIVFLARPATGPHTLIKLKEFFDGDLKFIRLPSFLKQNGQFFTSEVQLGINSRSNNKEEAWEFIKFLLSEKAQLLCEQPEIMSFPVHKNAFKKVVKQLDKDDQTFLDGFMQDISRETYTYYDDRLMNIILEETERFINNNITAEEVAKAIQSRVELYIGE